MPLPLIALWGLGAVAVTGLGYGVKGAIDNSDANDINSEAQNISYEAQNKLETTKNDTNTALSNYGQSKLDAFEKRIGTFVTLFDQLKNVEISRSTELDNLQLGNFTSVNFADIKESYSTLSSITQGFTVGAASGALVAYGAYAGTMTFATASTGAAISTVFGAAAKSATLAWLGGGTLAAGGAGIAGGAMVLGGLVVAPASLIFGGIFAAKASQKLSEARTNRINAKEYREEVDIVCQKLNMIQEVVQLASNTLIKTSDFLDLANQELETIILQYGTEYSQFSNEDKNTVFKSMKYAQLLKAIIDCPVLDENGGANTETETMLTELNMKLIS